MTASLDALVEDLPMAKGHWLFEVYEGDIERDAEGRILNTKVDEFEGENTITTNGKGLLLDKLFGIGAPAAITSMGVGASATASAAGDTQLGTTPTIKALDSTPTRASLTVTCICTFGTADANINWQELGLFNGTVNGTSIMFNRIAPIGPFNKTSAVSIVVTVTVTQS